MEKKMKGYPYPSQNTIENGRIKISETKNSANGTSSVFFDVKTSGSMTSRSKHVLRPIRSLSREIIVSCHPIIIIS
jgi:hypothetical protein